MSPQAGWEIYQDKACKWRWRYLMEDDTHEDSANFFLSRPECVIDAKCHGFTNRIDGIDLYHGKDE